MQSALATRGSLARAVPREAAVQKEGMPLEVPFEADHRSMLELG